MSIDSFKYRTTDRGQEVEARVDKVDMAIYIEKNMRKGIAELGRVVEGNDWRYKLGERIADQVFEAIDAIQDGDSRMVHDKRMVDRLIMQLSIEEWDQISTSKKAIDYFNYKDGAKRYRLKRGSKRSTRESRSWKIDAAAHAMHRRLGDVRRRLSSPVPRSRARSVIDHSIDPFGSKGIRKAPAAPSVAPPPSRDPFGDPDPLKSVIPGTSPDPFGGTGVRPAPATPAPDPKAPVTPAPASTPDPKPGSTPDPTLSPFADAIKTLGLGGNSHIRIEDNVLYHTRGAGGEPIPLKVYTGTASIPDSVKKVVGGIHFYPSDGGYRNSKLPAEVQGDVTFGDTGRIKTQSAPRVGTDVKIDGNLHWKVVAGHVAEEYLLSTGFSGSTFNEYAEFFKHAGSKNVTGAVSIELLIPYKEDQARERHARHVMKRILIDAREEIEARPEMLDKFELRYWKKDRDGNPVEQTLRAKEFLNWAAELDNSELAEWKMSKEDRDALLELGEKLGIVDATSDPVPSPAPAPMKLDVVEVDGAILSAEKLNSLDDGQRVRLTEATSVADDAIVVILNKGIEIVESADLRQHVGEKLYEMGKIYGAVENDPGLIPDPDLAIKCYDAAWQHGHLDAGRRVMGQHLDRGEYAKVIERATYLDPYLEKAVDDKDWDAVHEILLAITDAGIKAGDQATAGRYLVQIENLDKERFSDDADLEITKSYYSQMLLRQAILCNHYWGEKNGALEFCRRGLEMAKKRKSSKETKMLLHYQHAFALEKKGQPKEALGAYYRCYQLAKNTLSNSVFFTKEDLISEIQDLNERMDGMELMHGIKYMRTPVPKILFDTDVLVPYNVGTEYELDENILVLGDGKNILMTTSDGRDTGELQDKDSYIALDVSIASGRVSAGARIGKVRYKDRESALKALKTDPNRHLVPDEVSVALANRDRDVALACVNRKGMYLSNIPNFQDDPEIVRAALLQDGFAIMFVDDALRAQRSYQLLSMQSHAMRTDSLVRKCLIKGAIEQKNLQDTDFMLDLLKKRSDAVKQIVTFDNGELLKNREFVLDVMQETTISPAYFPLFRSDYDLASVAVAKTAWRIEYFDPKIIDQELIRKSNFYLEGLYYQPDPTSQRRKSKIEEGRLMKLFTPTFLGEGILKNPKVMDQLRLLFEGVKDPDEPKRSYYATLLEKVDHDVMLTLLREHGHFLDDLPHLWEDKEAILAAITKHPMRFTHAYERPIPGKPSEHRRVTTLLEDTDFLRSAMRVNHNVYKEIPPEYRSDVYDILKEFPKGDRKLEKERAYKMPYGAAIVVKKDAMYFYAPTDRYQKYKLQKWGGILDASENDSDISQMYVSSIFDLYVSWNRSEMVVSDKEGNIRFTATFTRDRIEVMEKQGKSPRGYRWLRKGVPKPNASSRRERHRAPPERMPASPRDQARERFAKMLDGTPYYYHFELLGMANNPEERRALTCDIFSEDVTDVQMSDVAKSAFYHDFGGYGLFDVSLSEDLQTITSISDTLDPDHHYPSWFTAITSTYHGDRVSRSTLMDLHAALVKEIEKRYNNDLVKQVENTDFSFCVVRDYFQPVNAKSPYLLFSGKGGLTEPVKIFIKSNASRSKITQVDICKLTGSMSEPYQSMNDSTDKWRRIAQKYRNDPINASTLNALYAEVFEDSSDVS